MTPGRYFPSSVTGSVPRATSSLIFSMLCSLTCRGTVSSLAAGIGIPTSLMDSRGSGEITVRAEKFTRLPDRLDLKRPSFPFSLWVRVFRGRPDLCLAGGMPEVWLSK